MADRKEGGAMAERKEDTQELYRLVVEEVDQARDTFELVSQLQRGLPIMTFDDIRRVLGGRETVTFRGHEFSLDAIEAQLPEVALGINDLPALVRRVATLVRMVPDSIGLDPSDPATAKRALRRMEAFGWPPNGWPSRTGLGRGAIPRRVDADQAPGQSKGDH
jgi:hypothetical protein